MVDVKLCAAKVCVIDPLEAQAICAFVAFFAAISDTDSWYPYEVDARELVLVLQCHGDVIRGIKPDGKEGTQRHDSRVLARAEYSCRRYLVPPVLLVVLLQYAVQVHTSTLPFVAVPAVP